MVCFCISNQPHIYHITRAFNFLSKSDSSILAPRSDLVKLLNYIRCAYNNARRRCTAPNHQAKKRKRKKDDDDSLTLILILPLYWANARIGGDWLWKQLQRGAIVVDLYANRLARAQFKSGKCVLFYRVDSWPRSVSSEPRPVRKFNRVCNTYIQPCVDVCDATFAAHYRIMYMYRVLALMAAR